VTLGTTRANGEVIRRAFRGVHNAPQGARTGLGSFGSGLNTVRFIPWHVTGILLSEADMAQPHTRARGRTAPTRAWIQERSCVGDYAREVVCECACELACARCKVIVRRSFWKVLPRK
jgi:hypothetical protein